MTSRLARIWIRIWIGLGAIALCAAYLLAYHADTGVPGSSRHDPAGWWGWFDQSLYLASAQAFAAGDLDPARHWYPPGYALLLAAIELPLAWTGLVPWRHAALLPDLMCLLAAYAGFLRFARACGVATAWSVPLFLLGTIASRPILASWVEPWNSSLSTALVWWLLALTVPPRPAPPGHAAAQPRGRRRVGLVLLGVVAAWLPVTRPTDLLLVVLWGGVMAVRALASRHRAEAPAPGELRWLLLGLAIVLLPIALLHLRIYGPYPSRYMIQSRSLGFQLSGFGMKAYTMLISARPWYPEGSGLLQRLPWIAFGIVGIVALPALPRDPARASLALLALLIVPYMVLFLSYTDLLPSGLWRYHNVHYFKWTLPGLALLGFVALRALLRGPNRRTLAALFAATLVVLSVRVMPVPATPSGDAWLVQYAGPVPGFRDTYFSHVTIRDRDGLKRNILQFRSLPDTSGTRLVALAGPFVGPIAIVSGDPTDPKDGPGVARAPPPRRWNRRITLGWPCWLPDYSCRRMPGS